MKKKTDEHEFEKDFDKLCEKYAFADMDSRKLRVICNRTIDNYS